MKKLGQKNFWDRSDEKINEIVDWINLQEKKDDFLDAIDDFKPKKLEVRNYKDESPFEYKDESKGFMNFCYTNEENEVIKKCLKYCNHRQSGHFEITGIDRALSREDLKVFRDILKKI